MARIIHALFTESLGGLEQAYLDITAMLVDAGHEVIAMLHPDAPYRDEVTRMGVERVSFRPRGYYDMRTAWQVRRWLQQLHAKRPIDALFAHSPRAVATLERARHMQPFTPVLKPLRIPLVGISHSHKTDRMQACDHLVCLTSAMCEDFMRAGWRGEAVHIIPNMISLPPEILEMSWQKPPVIGALGRFTSEKGMDVLMESLGVLHERGMEFLAIFGGDGDQADALHMQAKMLDIADRVQFMGWVRDKTAFFDRIDVLVVPSREESFGLVILEAMAHGVPVVAASAQGPASIITHEQDALLVPVESVSALADALQFLTKDKRLANRLRKKGWDTVSAYATEAVLPEWQNLVRRVTT